MADHVCPVWVGYFLASPLRLLMHNPSRILSPYVRPGMTVLDIGCAMGFFSLPMAERVGDRGRVICVDLQERMLARLRSRAQRAGLLYRLETRRCDAASLGIGDLAGKVDFALAFAVVHEVPDPMAFFSELRLALKPEGGLLVAEPTGRVSQSHFERSMGAAVAAGFLRGPAGPIRRCRAALLSCRV